MWKGPRELPITLKRVSNLEPVEFKDASEPENDYFVTNVPVRQPSQLPPPGNLRLNIQLGRVISDESRIATVYELNFNKETIPDGSMLPPLVAKMARAGMKADITKEARYYHELECLQGCAVPRCWGLFEAKCVPPQHVHYLLVT